MRPRVLGATVLLVAAASISGHDRGAGAFLDVPAARAEPDPASRLVCVQRWSEPNTYAAACEEGEALAGGGCTCPSGQLRASYPSGTNGGPATSWQCEGNCGSGLEAIAMCCRVEQP